MFRRTMSALLLLCCSAASADAATGDLCFHYGGSPFLVARGALPLPADDHCVTLPMFESQPSRSGAATGTLCRGFLGKSVTFQYTYSGCLGPDSYVEIGTCRLLSAPGGPGVPAQGDCRGVATHGPLHTTPPIIPFFDTRAVSEECAEPPWAVPDGFTCDMSITPHE